MVTQAQLTSGNGGTASSYTTASISPSANNLLIVSVVSKIAASDPNTPTCTGLSQTWAQVATVLQTGSQHVRLTMFRALSQTSITAGTLAISYGGQSQDDACWNITTFSNVFVDSSNGANTIIQTITSNTGGTNPSVSYSTFAKSTNAAFGVVGSLNLSTTYTPGGSFSQIFSSTGSEEIVEGAFQNTSASSVSWTQGTSTYPTAVIALELNFQQSGFIPLLL